MFNVSNLTIARAPGVEISSPEPAARMALVERGLLMMDDGALVRTRLVDVDLGTARK